MACVQPLGLPLQDIVGTGFEHEGTERNRLAKQGWKEGDTLKFDVGDKGTIIITKPDEAKEDDQNVVVITQPNE